MANRSGDQRIADGFPSQDLRIGQQGELIVSQLHGDGYEQAIRRNTYFSTSIARAVSLGSTTMVGHILWNPPDSGVNAALRRWSSSVHVTSATLTGILLGGGYQSTQPTAVTAADRTGSSYLTFSGATNQLLRTGKVQAYASCTLLFAPLAVWLLHHNTAAIATTGVDGLGDNLEGSFVIPPGGILCTMAQGAAGAAASHTSSFLWEEVPLVGVPYKSMADNVTINTGQLVVASEEDAAGVQHQKLVNEFMAGPDRPVPVGVGVPMPTTDDPQNEILLSILIEMRVQNEMLYAYMNTEVEPLELLRAKYRSLPVTL